MNQHTLQFHVDSLERRQLLDGNVNVVLTAAGDLRVTGDNQSNQITIRRGALDQVIVAPRDNDTSINDGDPGTQLTLQHNGLRDLKVTMKGGDDVVLIMKGPINPRSPLTFRNATLIGGPGSDSLLVLPSVPDGVRFTGNVKVILGPSSTMQSSNFADAEIGGNLSVRGGRGREVVTANRLRVGGRTSFILGAGDDTLHLQKPAATAVRSTFEGRLLVNMGGGLDKVTVDGTTTNGAFVVNLGAGNDWLELRDATISGPLTVNGGPGMDSYTMTFETSLPSTATFRSIVEREPESEPI